MAAAAAAVAVAVDAVAVDAVAVDAAGQPVGVGAEHHVLLIKTIPRDLPPVPVPLPLGAP